MLAELRVPLRHLVDHEVGDAPEIGEPDAAGLLNRAPDDPAKDVPPPFVRREHAVGDQERHAPAVVGDDPMSLRRLVRALPGDAALRLDPVHQDLEPVGLVDSDHVLLDRGGPVEPEPGVDHGLRQRRQRPVGRQVVLHEDEVPELEIALTGAPWTAIRAPAGELLPAVVVHLGAWPAGAGLAGLPEVLRPWQPDDALARKADSLPGRHCDVVLAQAERRVAREDAHPELVEVELEVVAHELPGELDRAFLEVLADREVAHHLEEGEVVAVEPDLVDVGRPERLLEGRHQRGRRLLRPEEVRLQWLHSGADQQRGGVFRGRDQRRRRQTDVALRLEEEQVALADLGGRPHRADCRCGSRLARRRGGAAETRATRPRTLRRSLRGSSPASAGSTGRRASGRSRSALRSATA